MKPNRKYQRFIRRLETEFTANNQNYIGISSDFSEGGLFVRTNHAFAPGTIVDLTIYLPDGNTSKLKGRVKRALKTTVVSLKNGMGVEIIEKDPHYINFMTSFSAGPPDVGAETKPEPGNTGAGKGKAADTGPGDFLIVPCSKCGVKNKVYKSKMSAGLKCGKCGAPLTIQA